MSVISNSHSFMSFDSKTSKAAEGQRLARIGYKATKDNPNPRKSICVSLPFVRVSDQLVAPQFRGMVVACLESAQDGIIRQLYENGAKSVHDEQISVDACIAWIDAENAGGRITAEAIGTWFDSRLSDVLSVAFADKLGISDTPNAEEEAKIGAIVAEYRKKFASLSGSKTLYSVEIVHKLQKALELADSDESDLFDRLQTRLAKMLETPKAVDLLGL